MPLPLNNPCTPSLTMTSLNVPQTPEKEYSVDDHQYNNSINLLKIVKYSGIDSDLFFQPTLLGLPVGSSFDFFC